MAADPITLPYGPFSNVATVPISLSGNNWSNDPPGVILIVGDETMAPLLTPPGATIAMPSGVPLSVHPSQ